METILRFLDHKIVTNYQSSSARLEVSPPPLGSRAPTEGPVQMGREAQVLRGHHGQRPLGAELPRVWGQQLLAYSPLLAFLQGPTGRSSLKWSGQRPDTTSPAAGQRALWGAPFVPRGCGRGPASLQEGQGAWALRSSQRGAFSSQVLVVDLQGPEACAHSHPFRGGHSSLVLPPRPV